MSFYFHLFFSYNNNIYILETKDVEEKPQNKSKLGSIHFPQISGIFNRFRKTAKSDDIELGPQAAKAGLASMETLDDSTKDPWNQEEQDAVDAAKLAETVPDEKKPIKEEEGEKNLSVYQQIRNYNCSIGEYCEFAKKCMIKLCLFLTTFR